MKRGPYKQKPLYYGLPIGLWNKLYATNGHWLWLGQRDREGYGVHNPRPWKDARRVHKKVYEALKGPVPLNYDLHHLCPHKHCAYPLHLALLSKGEHTKLHHFTD